MKGFITERRKGVVSWVRFGGEGLHTLLKSVEICCKEGGNPRRTFEWKENGRFYKLESHKNDAGKFMSCLVIAGEGKRHKIFILEGWGLIKGWALLADKLRELGFKGTGDEGKAKGGIKELVALEVDKSGGEERKRSTLQGRSFADVMKVEKCLNLRMIWIDAGEGLPREAMGTLKFCVVGSWENPLESYPTPWNWKLGPEQHGG